MPRNPTYNLLGALSLTLTDRMEAMAREASGFSASICALLVTLGPYPGSTIGGIARVLGLTHSVAVRLVEDLVRRGLIVRAKGEDRREIRLCLSREGVAVRQKIVDAREAVLKDALAALGGKEHPSFGKALSAILTRLTRSREDADHMCRLCDEFVCTPTTCPVEREAVRRAKESCDD